MKIRTKIGLYLGPFTLIVVTAIFVANYYLVRSSLEKRAQEELTRTQQDMHRAVNSLLSTAISNYLRGITEKNIDFIQQQYDEYTRGRISEQEAKANIQRHFDIQYVGDSGYLTTVEERGEKLYLDLHPFLPMSECTATEGCRAWVATRNGYTEYNWQNPLDNSFRKKAAYVTEFPPWNWIVGASSYREEFVSLVKLDDLRQLISPVRINETGYFFVFDENDRLLIHPEVDNLSEVGLVNTRGENIMHLLKESEDGYLTYFWQNPSERDERQKYAFIDKLDDYNWYLVATGYTSEVFEPLDFLKHLTVIMVLITAVLLSAIIIRLSRNLSIPLHNLKNGTDSFYKEKREIDWQRNPIDEIDVLGNAFARMTRELDHSMAALEEKNEALARSEKHIEENRMYLDSIINSMPSAIIGVNPELRVTLWNDAAEEASGFSQNEALGNSLLTVFKDLEPHRQAIVESLSTRKIRSFQYGPDNSEKASSYRAVTTYPLISQTNEGAVIRIDDITERVEMELRLRHSQKMDAVGQLAGGIAHDFNNMLGGIIGAAELLHGKVNPEDQKLVKIISDASGRTADLIQKLLTFSRKEAVSFAPVNVHGVILNTCELLKRSIDKRVQVKTRLRAESAMVKGDWSLLQNSLLNMGINGAQAMPEGGILTFSSETTSFSTALQTATPIELQPGTYLKIEVIDTGCGIPPEDLKNIFEPFFTTKQHSEGTGLGLAAVYGMVQQHNGAVTVSSQVTKGTTFSLYLPLIEAKEESVIEEQPILTGEGCVLIVDDEPVVRETAKMMLEQLGYTTYIAENGKQGLDAYQQHGDEINLVLLDVIMPVMDGIECFHRLREMDPEAKVIISSGFTRDADLNSLKEKGLIEFIRKPYTLEQLSKIAARVLQNPKHHQN